MGIDVGVEAAHMVATGKGQSMRSPTCHVCDAPLRRADAPSPCPRCGFTWLTPFATGRFDYSRGYDEGASYNALPPDAVLEHYRRAPNTAWALERLGGLHRSG